MGLFELTKPLTAEITIAAKAHCGFEREISNRVKVRSQNIVSQLFKVSQRAASTVNYNIHHMQTDLWYVFEHRCQKQ